jgi:hypothetical protein
MEREVKNRSPKCFDVVAAMNRLTDLYPLSISHRYPYSVGKPLPRLDMNTEYWR